MATKLEKMILNKNMICRKYITPNRPHSHNLWELVFFEKGETGNIVNGVEYNSKSGDVFLIGPPHVHAIKFITTPHLHRDLYYSDEAVRAVCDCFSSDLYQKACSGEVLHFHMSANAFQTVLLQADKLESLSVIASTNNGITYDELKKISESLLHFVIGSYRMKMLTNTSASPKWMLDILLYLNSPENFTKSVNDIIAGTYYSHTTVAAAFRQYLGVTLSEYLINLRLDYAAELLIGTNKTALEICSAAGYDSFSYFIKQFKVKFGVTPHKYRSDSKKK